MQQQPNQHQNQIREGDPKFYTKGNIASYTNSTGEHIVALISTNPYETVYNLIGLWQIATVPVHLRRKCFMKAIGNVMRERTNVLCIEYNKLCVVYLWNIQLHNDESHHLHVPHSNSHSLILRQRRALLHICGSTRPQTCCCSCLASYCNIDKQLCETFVIYSANREFPISNKQMCMLISPFVLHVLLCAHDTIYVYIIKCIMDAQYWLHKSR